MAPDRPLWRVTLDQVDQKVAPVAEQIVRTDAFADAVGALSRMRYLTQRRIERTLRNQWHFWNLPAGSDVKRLSEQVASLERRVRDLSRQLDDARREAGDEPADRSAQPDRARRTSTTRRRTVRPPGA